MSAQKYSHRLLRVAIFRDWDVTASFKFYFETVY